MLGILNVRQEIECPRSDFLIEVQLPNMSWNNIGVYGFRT